MSAPLLSTGQAAKSLGVSKTKLLTLIRTKRLACVMLDNRIRVDIQVLDDFRANLPQEYVPGDLKLVPNKRKSSK
jgi:excisionase family DNA binding protein